ncbi:MAG: hypothetical protein Q4D79_00780 [Propionibacteriaceae bacterium]|nr:hypothetical protein [Propionibacteriaceae bacterium]
MQLLTLLGGDLKLDGEWITVNTPASDEVVLTLFQHGAYDLEITAPSLEDAFFALTEQD